MSFSASRVTATVFNALAFIESCSATGSSLRYAFGFASLGAPMSATIVGLSLIPQFMLARFNFSHLTYNLSQIKEPEATPFKAGRCMVFPIIRAALPHVIGGAAIALATTVMPPEAVDKLKKISEQQTSQSTAPAAARAASAPQ